MKKCFFFFVFCFCYIFFFPLFTFQLLRSTVLSFSAAILILLSDLLMLFIRICLSAKPEICKLASLKQSGFLYGLALSKPLKTNGSVDVVKQNHMPISWQCAVNAKALRQRHFDVLFLILFRYLTSDI